jgi:ZIP family zinc transporter
LGSPPEQGVPVLFTSDISDRLLDALLGFAAGVMLAAMAFTLIVPAAALGGIWPAVFGILVGGPFLDALDRALPDVHRIRAAEGPSSALKRVWLLIIAITLHNFPEGLVVGVGFGSDRLREAIALMNATALQNVPEGLFIVMMFLDNVFG